LQDSTFELLMLFPAITLNVDRYGRHMLENVPIFGVIGKGAIIFKNLNRGAAAKIVNSGSQS